MKHFRSINNRIFHFQMIAIPQCRVSTNIKIATLNLEAMHVPEWIIPLKATIYRFNVAAFFNCQFTL